MKGTRPMIGRIMLLLAASTIVLVAALAQAPDCSPTDLSSCSDSKSYRLRTSFDPQRCSRRARRTSGSRQIEL